MHILVGMRRFQKMGRCFTLHQICRAAMAKPIFGIAKKGPMVNGVNL
jgi:hypothetical protein